MNLQCQKNPTQRNKTMFLSDTESETLHQSRYEDELKQRLSMCDNPSCLRQAEARTFDFGLQLCAIHYEQYMDAMER